MFGRQRQVYKWQKFQLPDVAKSRRNCFEHRVCRSGHIARLHTCTGTLACRCVGTHAQMWCAYERFHVLALVAFAKTCCARVHVVSCSRSMGPRHLRESCFAESFGPGSVLWLLCCHAHLCRGHCGLVFHDTCLKSGLMQGRSLARVLLSHRV